MQKVRYAKTADGISFAELLKNQQAITLIISLPQTPLGLASASLRYERSTKAKFGIEALLP